MFMFTVFQVCELSAVYFISFILDCLPFLIGLDVFFRYFGYYFIHCLCFNFMYDTLEM